MAFGSGSSVRGVSITPWANISLQQEITYERIVPRTVLPVTLLQVREQLKDPDDSDEYLTLLINSAADFFERYTNQILTNSGFLTFRDFFTEAFELRRAKFQALDAFTYLVDGVATVVPVANFYTTNEVGYSRIVFNNFESMPQNKDDRLQSVTIEFTAGFGAAQADIPSDVQLALLQHITWLNENRGDCNQGGSDKAVSLPTMVRSVYDRYQILGLTENIYRQ